MKNGNIVNGPDIFELGMALFAAGRSVSFRYMDDKSDDPQTVQVSVKSVDNLDGRGTFKIKGLLFGFISADSDGQYSAKYNPMTGEGTFEIGV